MTVVCVKLLLWGALSVGENQAHWKSMNCQYWNKNTYVLNFNIMHLKGRGCMCMYTNMQLKI